MSYSIRWTGNRDFLPFNEDGSCAAPISATDEADQLRTARADQSRQPDNFPFSNREADVANTARARQVANFQDRFADLRLELG